MQIFQILYRIIYSVIRRYSVILYIIIIYELFNKSKKPQKMFVFIKMQFKEFLNNFKIFEFF